MTAVVLLAYILNLNTHKDKGNELFSNTGVSLSSRRLRIWISTNHQNRKEGIMKARNCCKTMEAELTAWKANVYDIARKMEELPGGEKERILPNIEDLHMLIAEMDDRIEQIRENCTPETCIDDIITEREEFNKHMTSLRVKADEAIQILGAGNFGG
jgi:hypothetical protein